MPEDKPLIQFTPPQQEVFWATHRMMWLLWRRQLGKSFTLGAKALSRILLKRGHKAFFVSGTILMGRELIEKMAEIWAVLLDAYRIEARAAGLRMTSSADDDNGHTLDLDAIADIIEHNKLEIFAWHDNATYSRARVVSPNPDSARGYSGDVFGDEAGFWPDFLATMDAIEPIISRNPEWLMWLATSPPRDDAHPTFPLLLPQRDSWPANPKGNWYFTNTEDGGEGYPVHRVDAYDSALAGVPLYSLKDGSILTPDEFLRQAIDKDAARRNYFLEFLRGGASALSLQDLIDAQHRGLNKGMALEITDTTLQAREVEGVIPRGWLDLIEGGPITLGLDLATTDKATSNPAAISVMERQGIRYIERLVVSWKTRDERVTEAFVETILKALRRRLIRARRVSIDASNETFFAQGLARKFRPLAPFELVKGGENRTHQGETMKAKELLGSLFVNLHADGLIDSPEGSFMKTDRRLVKKVGGAFVTETGRDGKHGDTFDAGKLALWGHLGSGPAEAQAAGPGSTATNPHDDEDDDAPTRGPLAWLARGLGF